MNLFLHPATWPSDQEVPGSISGSAVGIFSSGMHEMGVSVFVSFLLCRLRRMSMYSADLDPPVMSVFLCMAHTKKSVTSQ